MWFWEDAGPARWGGGGQKRGKYKSTDIVVVVVVTHSFVCFDELIYY